ncbi:hypothetical protein K493DRAFT_301930 [Basidiobolus meristosporus CBS 931.73]|uniref:SCP domain-containing protein n=1 Tax=Basidiobolus meristosporus CBS 931.73 TaxID=1314790 RepID=A0A1Y1Y9K9_9FUNG|nr:hypothetical protein K493DRAFT_301930 [Basidiobolus meristosporus CBS 931.73]|eukprot:ORX94653.1 hypothetical protein K493DRAFT_301930 [Basidiobolus meristosporus CBS 931.73]
MRFVATASLFFCILAFTMWQQAQAISMRRLICLVNRERVSRGIKPLILSSQINEICQEHSVMQANFHRMTHDRIGHSQMNRALTEKGLRWDRFGENVARGQQSEEAVMYSWMHSPVHRANILKSSFTHMGGGYDSRGHYWTQGFARLHASIDYRRVAICP